MRRYFFSEKNEITQGSILTIDGELFKHIFIVCRRKEKDGFELITEDSKAYFVRVVDVLKNSAQVEVLEERNLNPLAKPYIHLVLANPRPQVLEKVIEKSVELGVKSLFPLVTENSFFKTEKKIIEKQKRLSKIILQAQQQSARGEAFVLHEPQKISNFLEGLSEYNKRAGFVLYESDEALLPEKILGELSEEVDDVFLVVGAEGGFESSEVKGFEEAGFKSIYLGHQILRVETACVAGISILKSRMGLWV